MDLGASQTREQLTSQPVNKATGSRHSVVTARLGLPGRRDRHGLGAIIGCGPARPGRGYRNRRTSERIMSAAMVLAKAQSIGDTAMVELLTCPECGSMTFAGSSLR
ncbi:hypothetical protein [Streptomyces vinaceus]|uniref:hypothetical protein n=1 Tax=Streptomyces vinaceus TaxID=1960 RepID=UPI00382CCF5B